MFLPYMTTIPQYYPVAPIGIPPGLSHAGIPSIQANPWMNPLQIPHAFPTYGYNPYAYGYRPIGAIPVGYGLSHAGQELPYNYLAQPIYGYGAIPHVPYLSPISPLYTGMPVQSPLQPNWSPVTPTPTQA